MALDLRPGLFLSIPCRACGRLNPFRITEGVSSFRCGHCGRNTEVELFALAGGWRIRTRATPEVPGP